MVSLKVSFGIAGSCLSEFMAPELTAISYLNRINGDGQGVQTTGLISNNGEHQESEEAYQA